MALPIQREKIEFFHYEFNYTTIINGWNSQTRRLIQIEASVALGLIFIFIQLICGSFRRKSCSSFVKLLLWVAYNTSYMLVASATSMMVSFPFNTELLAIWAICLYLVLGCTDTLSAYSLEDNGSWKKRYYQQILQSLYIRFIFGLSHKFTITYFFYGWQSLIDIRVFQRIRAYKMAGESFDLKKHSKVIADHMKSLHEKNQQGQLTDPASMSGYDYVVTGEEKLKPEAGSHTIEIDIDAIDTITVDKVSKCKGMLLNPVRDSGSKLRDVCLSFALFKMLRRRFSGYPFAECQDQQTKDFVFKGLLSEDGDFDRAFRVVEIELAFLYDYFYTKYPVIYLSQIGTLLTSLVIIIADCIAVKKAIEVKGIPQRTIFLTLLFVVLLIFFEIIQIVIYLKSDWAKVYLTSKYVAKPQWQGNPWIERILGALCNERGHKRWQNRLGQYSLLQSYNYRPKCSAMAHYLTFELIDKKRKGQKKPGHVDIPGPVKREIISALKLSNGSEQMKNGLSSLDRNGVGTSLSWACSLQSDTETILIWHVATSLCEILYPTNQQQPTADRITVASCLSKYCAYLVAFAPELLPDNIYDSELSFDKVVQEAKGDLQGAKNTNEVYERLIERSDIFQIRSNNSILAKGASLANDLLVNLDEPMRWKVLAEFWAEMILYITPSDNATAHLKHLTKGGEFLTHLWALLSHAGILERPPKTNRAGSETA